MDYISIVIPSSRQKMENASYLINQVFFLYDFLIFISFLTIKEPHAVAL